MPSAARSPLRNILSTPDDKNRNAIGGFPSAEIGIFVGLAKFRVKNTNARERLCGFLSVLRFAS